MFSPINWAKGMLLAKQLHSTDPQERMTAAEQLGEIGTAATVKLLTPCLKDEHDGVRLATARALRRLGDLSAIEALIEGLAEPIGGSWQVEILATLEQFNDPRAIPACIQALKSHDPRVRRAAASTLGTLGATDAVAPLLEAVQDDNADAGRDAAYALSKIGQPALPGLIKILQEGPPQAKISAAVALGIIADRSAIPAMLEALKDKDCYLQIAVAKALPQFNDPSVIVPLVQALEVSASAAFYYGVRDEASAALRKIGSASIEPLLAALKTASHQGCLAMIAVLHDLPDPRSFEPLSALLQHADLDVRKAALAELVKLDPQRAVGHATPLLAHANATLRYSAGEALVHAGWQAPTPVDRARLAIALGHYAEALKEGEAGLTLVRERLQDSETTVRRDAARALGKLKNKALLPSFQAATAHEKEAEAQEALVEAIEAFGPDAIEPLVALLVSGCWSLRRLVAQCLLRHGWQPQTSDHRALMALANGKTDAVVAVGEAARPWIESALKEGGQEVKATAAMALRGMGK